MLEENFDMKTKIQEILNENDFSKKRARSMDIDDFLKYDSQFNCDKWLSALLRN